MNVVHNMRVVTALPPMFAEIDAAFDVADKPVIFAWGDAIYNPLGAGISPELMAHEAVHGARQNGDPAGWWRRYIAEPAFRLAEEVPAHQAEYQAFCEGNANGHLRNARRLFLRGLASRLSGPLYGRLISFEDARRAIKAA